MRILYVTTIGLTMIFFKDCVKTLIEKGHTVDIATNEEHYPVAECYREWGCQVFPISTSRSPFSMGNLKAIKQIRNLAKNYDIVHCHTPLAGMATRLGCKPLRKKQGLKVIYTAHGFHFYKGAPKKNWMIYYPIEKHCSRYTDTLIVINKEDLALANKKMKAKKVEYIPGVGIDTAKFLNTEVDVAKKREELGIPQDAKVLLSVGELNKNKNHQIVIKALGLINNPNIHYVVVGVGDQKENLEKLAKELNVNLHLTGYRTDVKEIDKIADLYIHPSFREGLPVALMEAISSNVDVICSNIRGSNDLVVDGLFKPTSVQEVKTQIERFLLEGHSNKADNLERIKNFDVNKVNSDIQRIYGLEKQYFMRVCFFNQWLGAGGAERTIMTLSKEFLKRGYEVDIVLLGNKIEYDIDERVNLYIIDDFSGHESFKTIFKKRKKRSQALKKIIETNKDDVLICLLAPTLFYTKGLKIPVISSERSNPLKERTYLKRILTNQLFKKTDGVIFQTEGVTKVFPKSIRKKGVVIGNPIGNYYKGEEILYKDRVNHIATVGRLFDLKDYPTLLRAFQIVLKTHGDYILDIYGDGPDKEQYVSLAKELGISDNVIFHGVRKDVVNLIANARCFAFSSKCEGMPNGLLEAFASGVPCVSTNCDFGPSEIIHDGQDGLLVKVGDYEGLAKAINRLIEDEEFSNQCTKESKKIFGKYSLENITNQYIDFINEVIDKKEKKL